MKLEREQDCPLCGSPAYWHHDSGTFSLSTIQCDNIECGLTVGPGKIVELRKVWNKFNRLKFKLDKVLDES